MSQKEAHQQYHGNASKIPSRTTSDGYVANSGKYVMNQAAGNDCTVESAMYPCTYCPSTFKSVMEMTDHVFIDHNKQQHKCECGLVFQTEDALANHQQTCNPSSSNNLVHGQNNSILDNNEYQKPLYCSKCQIYFATVKNLRQHCKRKHSKLSTNDRQFVVISCAMCHKKFRKAANLQLHVTLHPGATGDLCYCVCGERFSDFRDLQNHLVTTHEYKINTAEKSSSTLPSQTGNVKSSTGKPTLFKCKYCPVAYSDERKLDIHLRKHFVTKNAQPQPKSQPRFMENGPTFASIKRSFEVQDTVSEDSPSFLSHSSSKTASRLHSKIDELANAALAEAHGELIVVQSNEHSEDAMPTDASDVLNESAISGVSNDSEGVNISSVPGDDPDGFYPCKMCGLLYTKKGNLRRHAKFKHPGQIKEAIYGNQAALNESPKLKCRPESTTSPFKAPSSKSSSPLIKTPSTSVDDVVDLVEDETIKTPEVKQPVVHESPVRAHIPWTKPHQCPHCAIVLGGRKSLMVHVLRQHLKTGQQLMTEPLLKTKQNKNAVQPFDYPHVCGYCMLGYTQETCLLSHVQKHHDPTCVTLPNWKFQSPKNKATASPDVNISSTSTNETTDSTPKSKPRHHVNGSHGTLKCPFCSIPFGSLKTLTAHARIKHKVPFFRGSDYFKEQLKGFYKCEWCDLSFDRQSFLSKHTKQRHPTKWANSVVPAPDKPKSSFICVHCNRSFADAKNLTLHIRKIHDALYGRTGDIGSEMGVKCTYCAKYFNTPGGLTRHIRLLHNQNYGKDLKHFCPHCPKWFSVACKVTYHIKNMHPEKLNNSNEEVVAKMPVEDAIKVKLEEEDHMFESKSPINNVSADNTPSTNGSTVDLPPAPPPPPPAPLPYNMIEKHCKRCGTTYTGHPKTHLKQCGQSKAAAKSVSFSCPKCPKTFASIILMQNHKRSHRKDYFLDPLVCKVCGHKSHWSFSMKKHMEVHDRAGQGVFPSTVTS